MPTSSESRGFKVRKYIALTLVVALALSTQPVQAARGDIWSAKAIRALEGLLTSTGAIAFSTTATGGGQIASTLTISGAQAGSTLASDIVVNGTFTGNATGWTLGGGGGAPDWAYAANNVTHGNSGGTTALQPSSALTIVSGTVYVVQFTLSSWSAGTVTPGIGGASGSAVGANGTFRQIITATGTGNLLLTPTTTLVATIDTVSVQALTIATPWLTVNDASIPLHFYFGTLSSRNTFMGQNAGQYAGTSAANNTCVGGFACRSITNTNAVTGLGFDACGETTNGAQNTCIGVSSVRRNISGIRNTGVGDNALNGGSLSHINENVGVGYHAGANVIGDYNTWLGSSSGEGAGTVSGSLGVGYGAFPTSSNQAVIGGNSANSAITSFFFGQGITKVSPGNATWTATGGSGADNAGSSVTIAPGASTGTAVAAVNVQRNLELASGSTAQTQVPGLTVCPRKILSNTSATAQTIAIIDLPSNSAGGAEAHITVTCTDGTNFDSETVSSVNSFVNKATAITLGSAGGVTTATTAANNSGSCTIAQTWIAGTNQILLKVTPTFTTIVPTLTYAYVEVITHQASATAVACQ